MISDALSSITWPQVGHCIWPKPGQRQTFFKHVCSIQLKLYPSKVEIYKFQPIILIFSSNAMRFKMRKSLKWPQPVLILHIKSVRVKNIINLKVNYVLPYLHSTHS